jgi:hypothetical protein
MTNINSWEEFDVFSIAKLVKGHILAAVVFYSMEEYNLIEKLDMSEEKLLNFVSVRCSHCCNGRRLLCGGRIRAFKPSRTK